MPVSVEDGAVAIVGMSGRFPRARDLDQFWTNIRDGIEGVISLTDEEIRACGVDERRYRDSNYVKAGGVLDDVELFDAALFGCNAREAELMDPQHRLFLETAWEALESAGIAGEKYSGPIGVFAGSHTNTYLANNIRTHPDLIDALRLPTTLGNTKDYLCTRVSYKLNLTGPSVSVQTACSTSLVAVCLACQALLNYQCDTALAGGVTVWVPQRSGYRYVPGGILSPDGRCRAFDADAQGTGAGNGVGAVVLRRLADALESGDRIRAVILGWGLNNDGARKVGFTAPSVDGQARAIAMAHAMADIDPSTIGYVEAHGTGTPLGDPIEIAALARTFGPDVPAGSCAIGSVKTNIGHLDAAAGIAGLIKTVFALEHQELPPSLHYRTPNPQIDFTRTPLYVNATLQPWPGRGDTPRRAGVSAFGMGGTNAHVVLQEAPPRPSAAPVTGPQVIVLSARTDSALEAATDRLAAILEKSNDELADVAWTLQTGRVPLPSRRAAIALSTAEASRILRERDARRLMSSRCEAAERTLVFLFPGLGDQYGGMGRGLYEAEPVFREEVDRCAEIVRTALDVDLRELMFASDGDRDAPAAGAAAASIDLRRMLGRSAPRPRSPLDGTRVAHPAVFTTDYALAQLWMSRGVRPAAMIGYSVGEYVAACLSGVLTLQSALTMVVERARLIEELPGGAMLGIPLSVRELQPRLGADVWVAAINGPEMTVVAGKTDAIDELESALLRDGIPSRRLRTAHAFHSPLLEPIADSFARFASRIAHDVPSIPYVSNVTGTWVTADMLRDAEYWGRHAASQVRFADSVAQLAAHPAPVLLEVGLGTTLGALAVQHPLLRERGDVEAIASMPAAYDTQPDATALAAATGRLWLAGIDVEWEALHRRQSRRRVPLPTYPFERQRYWIDRKTVDTSLAVRIERKADIADWFYLPSWKRSLAPESVLAAGTRWIVVCNADGAGTRLAARLESLGDAVTLVLAGERFQRLDDSQYILSPDAVDDYAALFEELARGGRLPDRIAHTLLLDDSGDFDAMQRAGFYSVVALTRALAERAFTDRLALDVLTAGLAAVVGDERLSPSHATVVGACRVIPQEYPNIQTRVIDVDAREVAGSLDAIVDEMRRVPADRLVAYRHGLRWTESFEPVRLQPSSRLSIEPGSVFLITGGLGRVGRQLTGWLTTDLKARVVVIGRTGLPPRSEWPAIVESDGPVTERIRAVLDIEARGGEVVIESADVADPAAIRGVIDRIFTRFGRLDGVFHAAGIVGEETWRAISETDRASTEPHFAAKAKGLSALEAALQGRSVGMRILFSSTASIFGGLGLAAYSAANCFMDAFAAARYRSEQRWCSVNWDGWRDPSAIRAPTGLGASIAGLAMEPPEAIDALRRVLARPSLDRIVVSLGDVDRRVAQWSGTIQEEAKSDSALAARHPRPSVRNAYVAPRTDTERVLANIWEEVLGVRPVGVFDNFFELGGHSLLGIEVALKVRAAFRVEVPVWSLFKTPTVADVSETILQVRARMMDDQALAGVLERVESLSDAEAAALLAGDSSPTPA